MTDFTPTPEAVEAAARAMWGGDKWEEFGRCYPFDPNMDDCYQAILNVEVGIAAFVEAERLMMDDDNGHNAMFRLVGPWRKRHASPDATQ